MAASGQLNLLICNEVLYKACCHSDNGQGNSMPRHMLRVANGRDSPKIGSNDGAASGSGEKIRAATLRQTRLRSISAAVQAPNAGIRSPDSRDVPNSDYAISRKHAGSGNGLGAGNDYTQPPRLRWSQRLRYLELTVCVSRAIKDCCRRSTQPSATKRLQAMRCLGHT